MAKTRGLRYLLFSALFALVFIGLIARSYLLLVVLAAAAVAAGIIADRLENRPTEPFKHYNALHGHKHGHGAEDPSQGRET